MRLITRTPLPLTKPTDEATYLNNFIHFSPGNADEVPQPRDGTEQYESDMSDPNLHIRPSAGAVAVRTGDAGGSVSSPRRRSGSRPRLHSVQTGQEPIATDVSTVNAPARAAAAASRAAWSASRGVGVVPSSTSSW